MDEVLCNCGNTAVECCSCSNPNLPLCSGCSHANYFDRNYHRSQSLYTEINQIPLLLLLNFCTDQIKSCSAYKEKVSKIAQSYIKNIEEISKRLIQEADGVSEECQNIYKFSRNLKFLKNFGTLNKIETLVRDGLLNIENLSKIFTLENIDKVFSKICSKCKLYEEKERIENSTNDISNKIINFRIAFDSKERLKAINKFNEKKVSGQDSINILNKCNKEITEITEEQKFIYLPLPHTRILLRYDLETFQRYNLEINGLENNFAYASGFSQTHDGLVFLIGGAHECINREDALNLQQLGTIPERFYLMSEDTYLIDPETRQVKQKLKGYNLSDCGSCTYLNNFIYIFGGCAYDESWKYDCIKYDIAKNSWIVLPSPLSFHL
ncbi:hypothetical protein SteCoe_3161 [Stentor coeruleus]|uniref:Kelch motif family protein n=1 Tax=Stentor coeruleus TaxID=5963 RepID=A0A1R2CXU9_9CILI|nr:hypothetical protein SteCoe_3161 [Stentor coeruleus]